MRELTDGQLDDFRQRLLESRDAAKALLAQSAAGSSRVEVSGSAIGRLTRIDAIQMQGMQQMNRAQLDVRLQQIEAALAAFAAGRYGSCNRCKGEIDLDRLQALPEAPLCMDCQEQIESQG